MSRSSFAVLLVARAGLEGFVLAALAVVFADPLGGPLPLTLVWIGIAGALLVLAGAQMLRRHRRAAVIAAIATAAFVAGATSPQEVGPLQVATRTSAGALLGGLLVWRGFALPVAVYLWRAMGLASLSAIASLAVMAMVLGLRGSADRSALVPLALPLAGLGVIGLSLARAGEELLTSDRRGPPRGQASGLTALAVGLGALLTAAAFPWVRVALAATGAALEPFVYTLLVLIVTPIAYVVEWLLRLILPVARQVQVRLPFLGPQQFVDPALEEELARQTAAQAEVFLRGFAVAVVTVIIVALALRALARRAVALPLGASLEREAVAGAGVADLLRRLLAERAPRPARPRGADAAARVRRAYWDMLSLAERVGAGWRPSSSTPREHHAGLGSRWQAGWPVVEAFERARYAGRANGDDAARAEDAVRELQRSFAEDV